MKERKEGRKADRKGRKDERQRRMGRQEDKEGWENQETRKEGKTKRHEGRRRDVTSFPRALVHSICRWILA